MFVIDRVFDQGSHITQKPSLQSQEGLLCKEPTAVMAKRNLHSGCVGAALVAALPCRRATMRLGDQKTRRSTKYGGHVIRRSTKYGDHVIRRSTKYVDHVIRRSRNRATTRVAPTCANFGEGSWANNAPDPSLNK